MPISSHFVLVGCPPFLVVLCFPLIICIRHRSVKQSCGSALISPSIGHRVVTLSESGCQCRDQDSECAFFLGGAAREAALGEVGEHTMRT